MYVPPAFAETRPEVLQPLLDRYPFALLVTHGEGRITASHLPLLADLRRGERGVLSGHLARANEQARHLEAGTEALAIFQGPHAYVSPSWYAAEQAVPTWNYAAVHAYGVPQVYEEPDRVRAYLERLVRTYEEGSERPWGLHRLSPEYVQGLARGIVCFELPIRRLEGKLKLGQNRSPADRAGVVEALGRSEDPLAREVGRLMQERQAE